MRYLFSAVVAGILLSSAAMVILPNVSYAANIVNINLPYWGTSPPLLSCTGLGCDLCDIIETFKRFIYFGMTLALFAIAPMIVVYGGIMIMTAGGSSSRLETGKKAIFGTAIGIALVLGAYLIVDTVIKTLVDPASPLASWSSFTCDPSKLPGAPQ